MRKYEYVHFYMDGSDSIKINEEPFKLTKIVYQQSKYEYVAEIADSEYNISYLICLYGRYAKGPYKSRHHAIKLLKNDIPSVEYCKELARILYRNRGSNESAFDELVQNLVRKYGYIDQYSLFLIKHY